MSLPEKIKNFNKERKITTSKPGREVLEVSSFYQTKHRFYMGMKIRNNKTRCITRKG